MTGQSATQRRIELDNEVTAAKAEEQRLRQQQRDATACAARLRQELAARPAAEYDEAGQPVPKSEAARLAAELDATTGVVFADRIKAAELHTRSARIARDRFTAAHVRDLVADAEPDAHQAVTDFNHLIEQLDRSIVDLGRFAASWAPILETVSGLDMCTELPTYDGLNGLRRVLRSYRNAVPAPLPRSIATPEGEQPPRVEHRGGWVSPAHAESSAEQLRKQAERQQRDGGRARRNPPATVR